MASFHFIIKTQNKDNFVPKQTSTQLLKITFFGEILKYGNDLHFKCNLFILYNIRTSQY